MCIWRERQPSCDELLRMFEVNAVAPLMVSRGLADLLSRGTDPCIMMSSSTWGSLRYKSDPTNNANDAVFGYSSSKAALNMIRRTLASALEPQGITVLTHHPGGKREPGGGPTRGSLRPPRSRSSTSTE